MLVIQNIGERWELFCRRKLERLRIRRKVMEQWSENGFKGFSKWVWEAQTVTEGNRWWSHVSSDGWGVWWSVREVESTTAWNSASVPRRPVLTWLFQSFRWTSLRLRLGGLCTALVVGSDDVAPSHRVGVWTRRQSCKREGSRGVRVIASY